MQRIDLYAFLLALVALVGAIALSIADKNVPNELWLIAVGAAGIGAGVHVPTPGE